ncbi:acyl-CoA dehydrogenase [Rhodococcus opacus]|nr:acyl-CoA dehydrogenase [Rhodococcus opacus]RZL79006.1 MAG: acyl-CoA dehydrogenase [Rhodococcus sp. (in: high G+C Gram-positive bacteria)]
MDFALSDEQEALAEAERAWLTRNDPLEARRPSLDDGPARLTPADIRHLAESGIIGLLTRDLGGTHVDLAVLVEEHGRAGSSVPLAELAVAARLLELLDHPAREDAESGAELVLPALGSMEDPALHAEIDGDSMRLSGRTAPVTGLLDADHVLLVAEAASGTEVAAVLPMGAVTVWTLETLDLTRSWSVIDVDVTLGSGEWRTLEAGTAAYVHDELATYRAFDALGSAARLVDLTVDYAGNRQQFGRPIASFQAIKHHCANMALSTEAARAALWAAAVALDDDTDTRSAAVSAAAAYAGDGTSTTAQTALQVHGGIGFTWEHDLHLLLRRIKVDELLDGTVSFHRRRLVAV